MASNIRSKLRNNKPSIGSWMQIPSSSVAEIMGRAGYDWVAVDLEHGGFPSDILPDIFRALKLGGTSPFARVAQCHPKDIKQALDAGAQGLILPMIESGDQLKSAISCALYPPQGTRGIGYCRANMFGKHFDGYLKNSEDVLFVAQIEHIRAVQNLDDILPVKGLDAVMIGPYDLSGSMNLTGLFDHSHFLQAMDTIFHKATEYNIPMGLHIVQPDKEILKSKILEEYQFIAYGIDAVFLYRSAEQPNYLNPEM